MANKVIGRISKTQWLFLLLSIAILTTGLLGCIAASNPAGDWMMYIRASRLYHDEMPIYNVLIRQLKHFQYFLYSPTFLFLLVPISFLPIFLSLALWYLLKLVLLFRVFKIASHYLDSQSLSENKRALIVFGTVLFSVRFLLYDFELGQLTLFLLWTMVEAWHQLNKQRLLLPTLLLAFGVFAKMLSVIFIPYLIYKRKFKVLIYMLLAIVFLAFLPFLFGGWEYQMVLLKQWLGIILPFASANGSYNATPHGLHDVFNAVPAWYVWLQSNLSLPPLDAGQLKTIAYLIVLTFGAGFIYISSIKPIKDNSRKNTFREIAYLLGCIPIIFPYQHKYSYVLMLPAMFYLMYQLVLGNMKGFGKVLIALAFLLMVASTDGIIGRPLNEITQEYKYVTLGGILLLLCVAFSNKSTTVSADPESSR